MLIAKKIFDKARDMHGTATPTIVFFGDSVTQGYFELEEVGRVISDGDAVYHNRLKQMIHTICPDAVVNIINSGIGGDSTFGALKRLQRDVLAYRPDLCVVCFGLNDSSSTLHTVEEYAENLHTIFTAIQEAGSEVIFLTHNMLNTYVLEHFPEGALKAYAAVTGANQTGGVVDAYVNAGIKAARACGAVVCDCYGKWKKLYESGCDVTRLLANGINHPRRSMHWLFASSLFDTIFFDR